VIYLAWQLLPCRCDPTRQEIRGKGVCHNEDLLSTLSDRSKSVISERNDRCVRLTAAPFRFVFLPGLAAGQRLGAEAEIDPHEAGRRWGKPDGQNRKAT
jgi:hypothetical protein